MSGRVGSFRYGRQFAALLVLALALWAADDRVPIRGAIARFGLFGALYSGVLAATIRAPATLRHRLLFIGLGALSSALNAAVGLGLETVRHALPGDPETVGILAACAGAGAALYATLMRLFWLRRLAPAFLWSVLVGCMLAVLGVFWMHAAARAGGAWIAVAWWVAFSLALWYHDRRDAVTPG